MFVIPKSLVTTRLVTLPSTDRDELKSMARFEAERHIPFNAERHIVAYHVLRAEGLGGARVLLAAADEPDLEGAIAIAEAAGISIEAIDVSSLAQFNSLAAQLGGELASETVCLIHLGAGAADISIVAKGELLFTRSAPIGYARLAEMLGEIAGGGAPPAIEELPRIDMTHPEDGLRLLGFFSAHAPGPVQPFADPAEAAPEGPLAIVAQWRERLVQEIRRTYEFARREFECPPIDSLALSGDAERWPGFAEFFSDVFHLPVRGLRPFQALASPPAAPPDAALQQAAYAAAAGALARYWRGGAVAIDLLPEKHRARGLARRRKQALISSALLLAALLALGGLFLKQSARMRQAQIERIAAEVERLRPLAEELIDKEKQLAIIDRYRWDKRSALAILDTISSYSYFPRNVALTGFDFVKDRSAKITGYALTLEDLNKFITDLEAATFENERIFSYIDADHKFGETLDRDRDQPLVRFLLKCYMD
ncbi:MAG: Competence protein A [candidate division BRC1 bacterium ADurb.BinA364]|nr:MAG: Competence protein A [candidate division BRC1 bacterium ADurb.BinA364]